MFKLIFLICINAIVLLFIQSYGGDEYGEYGAGGSSGYGGGGYGGNDPQGGGGNDAIKRLESIEEINNFLLETNDQATVIGYIDSSFETDLDAFEQIQSSWY